MPDPVLVMADRRNLPHHEPEAEPVTLEVVGEGLVLVLDDGQSITLDAREVGAVLGVAA